MIHGSSQPLPRSATLVCMQLMSSAASCRMRSFKFVEFQVQKFEVPRLLHSRISIKPRKNWTSFSGSANYWECVPGTPRCALHPYLVLQGVQHTLEYQVWVYEKNISVLCRKK